MSETKKPTICVECKHVPRGWEPFGNNVFITSIANGRRFFTNCKCLLPNLKTKPNYLDGKKYYIEPKGKESIYRCFSDNKGNCPGFDPKPQKKWYQFWRSK